MCVHVLGVLGLVVAFRLNAAALSRYEGCRQYRRLPCLLFLLYTLYAVTFRDILLVLFQGMFA